MNRIFFVSKFILFIFFFYFYLEDFKSQVFLGRLFSYVSGNGECGDDAVIKMPKKWKASFFSSKFFGFLFCRNEEEEEENNEEEEENKQRIN